MLATPSSVHGFQQEIYHGHCSPAVQVPFLSENVFFTFSFQNFVFRGVGLFNYFSCVAFAQHPK
jgi:hypothetical protein